MAKKTEPKAPLLIGLMISKSFNEGGVVRDKGAEDDSRGDSGPLEVIGLMAWTVECRLRCAPPDLLSVAVTIGETGGVMVSRGSMLSA